MYIALSPGVVPEIAERLSCFIALGPSVFSGPVLRRFPFSLMQRFRSRQWWSLAFGIKAYLPLISLFMKVLPTWLFGHIAAMVFAFIFKFHMNLTPKRILPKCFRTMPEYTSSELLYWYMSAFANRVRPLPPDHISMLSLTSMFPQGCIFDPQYKQPWFPFTDPKRKFPPHAVFYGTADTLVIGRPLVERLREYEPHIDILRFVELDGYEHLDFMFAHDAWRTTYPGILECIEASRDIE